MLPLNDVESNRYIRLPYMTTALIIANGMIMLLLYSLVPDLPAFVSVVRRFGTTPSIILSGHGSGDLTSLTHMFLHGGTWHLVGNMLGLWVYGRRVEDMCGPFRFLLFYLTCGVFAVLVSTLVQARSDIPAIGASGAVSGVMGAYLILFPKGRIRTFILLGVVPIFPKIRAYWLILYFLILQLPPAFDILVNQADYRIGYWAHLGGFFASLFILLFLRPEAFHRYRNELPL